MNIYFYWSTVNWHSAHPINSLPLIYKKKFTQVLRNICHFLAQNAQKWLLLLLLEIYQYFAQQLPCTVLSKKILVLWSLYQLISLQINSTLLSNLISLSDSAVVGPGHSEQCSSGAPTPRNTTLWHTTRSLANTVVSKFKVQKKTY